MKFCVVDDRAILLSCVRSVPDGIILTDSGLEYEKERKYFLVRNELSALVLRSRELGDYWSQERLPFETKKC